MAGTGKTILLVDDEEGIRKVLQISLADLGYPVYTAENGDAALRLVRDLRPAIVLTDIKMPGMDGIALLRQIKERDPDIEVIMLTGHGDLDLAIKSLKFEATDFITKPIQEDILEIALKRAWEKITMRRQLRAYTQELETLVAQKTAQLIEAERMAAIGQTVAGLSHTIRDIASSLTGGAFVLEKGIDHQDMSYLQQGWRMIRGSVDKIAGLSIDLLNYAKTSRVTPRRCDPNQPVQEVVEQLSIRAEEENVQLRFEAAQNLRPIECDPEAIHQCLLNLVANALDALREKKKGQQPKIVNVCTTKTDEGGVAYQVTDNGCGMGPDIQQKIFHAFFTTKGRQGTGIGLMMVKNIVDKHGGEIRVSSRKGEGATFLVRLPKTVSGSQSDELSG